VFRFLCAPRIASPSRRTASLFPALLVLVAACSSGGAGSAPVALATAPASPSGSILAGMAPSPTPSPAPAFPTTLTDDEGTAVTLATEPRTIVSLAPATTETLFALGVGDRIEGKSQDVFLYPPAAGDIPDVATFNSVDVEKIVAMSPDVVFAGGNSFTAPEAITRLRSLGIAVIVLYAPTIEAVYRDMELTGQAAGRSTEAAAMVERMRTEFDNVKAAVAGLPAPRVFYELDATGAIYGPADDSFLAQMIESAGGIPITTGSTEKYDIAVERLIQADPEVILLADAPYGVSRDQVAARPGWKVMTAVKTGAIRPIDDQTVSRPGPRLFLGLGLLARTIHPDAAIPSAQPIDPAP
jgi:iron complex transport system substrate-binding protein